MLSRRVRAGVLAIGLVLAGCGSPPPQPPPEPDPAEVARQAERAAAQETERLQALWTYHEVPAASGRQLTASIYSTEMLDTGGDNPARVQLVFRDHPSWGRSSYLVLQGGDFNCYNRCRVPVSVDAEKPVLMAARRPKTDEAIAMFIDDEAALWRMTRGARQLSIEFPVVAGGTRAAVFEVSGLDRSRLPGWDVTK